MHELKPLPNKAKVQGMVAMRQAPLPSDSVSVPREELCTLCACVHACMCTYSEVDNRSCDGVLANTCTLYKCTCPVYNILYPATQYFSPPPFLTFLPPPFLFLLLSPSSQSVHQRTTLIILCEDGSLRIYVANNNANTEYWMQPQFKPSSPLAILRGRGRKKEGGGAGWVEKPKFPVDYFEHCQALQFSDIEVGGEGREGRREGVREGVKEGGIDGWMEGGRKEKREGGSEGGKKGGKERGREGEREGEGGMNEGMDTPP